MRRLRRGEACGWRGTIWTLTAASLTSPGDHPLAQPPGHGRDQGNRAAREAEAARRAWLSDFSLLLAAIAAAPAAGYRHFAPNFVYRYASVPAITVSQAIDTAAGCRAHASWHGPGIGVEDLMVSVADKAWKGKRVPDLEDLLIGVLARASGREE